MYNTDCIGNPFETENSLTYLPLIRVARNFDALESAFFHHFIITDMF